MNYFHNPTKYLPTTTSSRFSQRCLCRRPPLLPLSPHLTKLTLVALAVLQNKLILLCRTPPTSIWLVVTYPEPLWPHLTWLRTQQRRMIPSIFWSWWQSGVYPLEHACQIWLCSSWISSRPPPLGLGPSFTRRSTRTRIRWLLLVQLEDGEGCWLI